MAKLRVEVKADKLKEGQVLAAVLKTAKAQKILEEKAREVLVQKAQHYEGYMRSAVSEIDSHLRGGVVGGSGSLSRLKISTPAGAAMVPLPSTWSPLTSGYVNRKGHDFFWYQRGLVAGHFRDRVVSAYAKKKFTRYTTRINRQRNGYSVTLTMELKALPEPYDELVRRPFLRGVQGGGLPGAPKPLGNVDRSGTDRVRYPERQRPLLRPIAYRMGRLALQNFRKTLEI